jgi:hypothetical protein
LSSIVEDCLITLARKQPTTRFIKLHHEIAEMDHIDAPALLAYKAGDVFATIVDIPRRLPGGRECSSESLEDLLKEYEDILPGVVASCRWPFPGFLANANVG